MDKNVVTTQEIWEQLNRKLLNYFKQKVSSRDAADDLLQEAFIRIHKSLDKLDNVERINSWVFQIARNLLIDYYRSKDRTPVTVDLETDLEEIIDDSVPDDLNINNLVSDWLYVVISELPEPYQEAVALYELERLPQQQIANKLGISLSGAKSRIQRGRDLLKQKMAKCCAFEMDRRGNVIGATRIETDSCCENGCN